MTSTETGSGSADRIIESFHDAGNMALESVRKLHGVVRLQPGGLNQGLGLAAERGP
jgi:transcription termination factor Rho